MTKKPCVPATAGTARQRQSFTNGDRLMIRHATFADVPGNQDGQDSFGSWDAIVPSTHAQGFWGQQLKPKCPVDSEVLSTF
ncbi:hypothetical protein PGTUg99_028252 [Puccinia graminis f. sp. tritici]|uniref:Uncharacterized protein n=1 Tax=Puccinia graminis f. sp. tritici TaxID=56615 RepID=A0A5B0Q461_PUCGR|nr:hypothetical protein PGTUg99_028252 [Puccinia graminis f. sp. tritici]